MRRQFSVDLVPQVGCNDTVEGTNEDSIRWDSETLRVK